MKEVFYKITSLTTALLMVLSMVLATGFISPTYAGCTTASDPTCTSNSSTGGGSGSGTGSAFTPGDVNGNTQVTVNTGGIGFSSIGQTISTLITFAIFLGAIIAFIFIVVGAFRYVAAGEDAGGTKAARTIITNAVVGLILLALTYVIFQIVIRVIPGLATFFSANQG